MCVCLPGYPQDCDVKMNYFLPRFAAVLGDPESAWADWQDEYTQVRASVVTPTSPLSQYNVCIHYTKTERGRVHAGEWEGGLGGRKEGQVHAGEGECSESNVTTIS